MKEEQLLEQMVDRICGALNPERIILFGSRVRGQLRNNSDYDLLVIQESQEPRYKRSVPLYPALADLPAEIDVLVYTQSEVEEWSQVPQAFVTTAIREGKVVYERKK